MQIPPILLWIIFISLMITSCGNPAVENPKPRTFPKVIYPEKGYQSFDLENCPFSFKYPVYAHIERKDQFFGEAPEHPCWFNISISEFDVKIHMSYLPIDNRGDFDKYIADSYKIANQINARSDYMDEFIIQRNGLGGLILEFEGHAASPLNFILTDTSNHFLRGAMYFNTAVRPDSLAPVIQFLKEDVSQLVETFEWKS